MNRNTMYQLDILRWTEEVVVLIIGVALVGLVSIPNQVQAEGFQSPKECLAYEGDAHLKCLYAYIQIQKGETSNSAEELQKLRSTMQDLQAQVSRQAAVTQELQQESTYKTHRYKNSYGYRVIPHVGLSLHLGKHSFLSLNSFPFSYPHYNQPKHRHKHRHKHKHRHSHGKSSH